MKLILLKQNINFLWTNNIYWLYMSG